MKVFYMAAMLVASMSISGCAQAQQVKLGHIDFQSLLTAMPEAKTLQTQLEAYGNELQATYDQYIGELQGRQRDYQASAATWSEVKREAAESDIQSLVARIEEFQTTSQEKLVAKQDELMAHVIDKATKAVEEVGKEQGLIYVFIDAGLLYKGEGAMDIMPLVKAKLNL